jgi:mannosyltransferase
MRRSISRPLALAGVVALAVVAFLWRLGASSLFIDETYSWHAGVASFTGVFRSVRATEVAPPLYYLLLHFWINILGSDSEWTMRSLSVLAGVGLVAGVWWLGRLVADGVVAALGGALVALSPLVVQYAQEVRAYVFAMLFTVLAVAAAVEATHRPDRARRWMAMSAAASIAAVWTHYTSLTVLAALAGFVWTEPRLSRAARRAWLLACATGVVIIAPLMIIQLRAGHQGGVAPFAALTATNFARVIGTPFDGRFAPQAMTYVSGALAVAAGLVVLGVRRGLTPRQREQWLLLGAALLPLLPVIGVTIAARVLDQRTYYSLITRYTAVAAPFMLIAIAIVIARGPRPVGVGLAGLVGVALVSGLSVTYPRTGSQPNLRAAFARVAAGYRRGDLVELAGMLAARGESDYYVSHLRRSRPNAIVMRPGGPLPALPRLGSRLWLLYDTGSARDIPPALAGAGWRPASTQLFDRGVAVTRAGRSPVSR